MSQLVQHRIDTATNAMSVLLDDLLREVRKGLDPADQRHLLRRLSDPENGGTGLLPLIAEVLTAASGTVREWQPNHEAAIEVLDDAAAYVADSAGQRLNTARNLLIRPAVQDWPTPEQAYAEAPSTISEIGWTARTATERLFGTASTREFWLRKAALLDRIALTEAATSDATELAVEAARRLFHRRTHTIPENPLPPGSCTGLRFPLANCLRVPRRVSELRPSRHSICTCPGSSIHGLWTATSTSTSTMSRPATSSLTGILKMWRSLKRPLGITPLGRCRSTSPGGSTAPQRFTT